MSMQPQRETDKRPLESESAPPKTRKNQKQIFGFSEVRLGSCVLSRSGDGARGGKLAPLLTAYRYHLIV